MLRLLGQGAASALLVSVFGASKAFAAGKCKPEGGPCNSGDDAECCSGYCNTLASSGNYCRDARSRPVPKPPPACKPSVLLTGGGPPRPETACSDGKECCSGVCRTRKLRRAEIEKFHFTPERVAAIEANQTDLRCYCLDAGEPCKTDNNCCFDLYGKCQNGVCVSTRPPCVPRDGVCKSTIYCCGTDYCDNFSGETGHCRQSLGCVPKGSNCRPDLDCCPGHSCHKGVCV
jgi:hypothetical protein